MSDALAVLSQGLAVCRVAVQDHGGLMASLALTGLVGSLTHCAGMCGPFVLSQTAARFEAIPASAMGEWRRLGGALLLPYHLGRATTYTLLGAAAGALTGRLADGALLRLVAGGLLALAALFLVGMAVPGLKAMFGAGGGESWWGRSLGRLAAPLFAAPTGWRGWLLGVALGFIPCGLLYAALAAAAAGGDAVGGALAMLSFVAGTVPVLVAVGMVGHFAVARWRQPVLKWAPLLLAFNAGILGFMAWRLIGERT